MTKKDFKKAYQRMVNAQRAAMFVGITTNITIQYTEANARFGDLVAYNICFGVYHESFEPFGLKQANFTTYGKDFDQEMSNLEAFLRSKGARI